MKTNIILAMVLLPYILMSQSAYLDAQRIGQFVEYGGNQLLIEAIENGDWDGKEADKIVLQNFSKFLHTPHDFSISYFEVNDAFDILDDVEFNADKEIIDENPQILFSNAPNVIASQVDVLLESMDNEVLEAPMSFSSGLNFTTKLVDGGARFLVDRTKKELTISFFEKFEEELNKPYVFDLRLEDQDVNLEVKVKELLPSTYMLLESNDIFDIPSMGPLWLSAFQQDINQVPRYVQKLFTTNEVFNNSSLGKQFATFLNMYQKLRNGVHPMEILDYYAYAHHDFVDSRFDRSINLLNLISKNITLMKNERTRWASSREINALSNYEKDCFIALITREGIHSTLFDHIHIKSYTLTNLAEKSNQVDEINAVVQQFVSDFSSIESIMSQVKMEDISSIIPADIIEEYLSKFYQTVYSMSSKLQALDELESDIEDILNNEDYSDFAMKLVKLTEAASFDNYGDRLLFSIQLLRSIPGIDLDQNPEYQKFVNKYTYYANFIVDFLHAAQQDNFDAKIILDKYALPVGSYRIKRHKKSSWDINAYPGLYLGYEFSDSESTTFGITAPIGFSYSFRNNATEAKSASSSIFISAIDICAPFSYRFNNDSAEGLPENIRWQQIFSPGIHYVYGFKNSPMSLSVGAQYTPMLRNINLDGNKIDDNIVRAQIALTVDIPVFNLKTN